ncbi:MAG TPA: methyltransferase domain-containing protein, partial [Methanospirillum sp.]|uniref:methyltransferase domain-containing protein n=1 Tax=Methanospirillum sp. TaxID=45200 RepID=UPI002C065D5F
MEQNHLKGSNPLSFNEQVFAEDFHRIDDVIAGFRRYRVLTWALESGIADILYAEGPQDPGVLVKKLGYQSSFGKFFLDALVEIGILEKKENKVGLCSKIAPYLVSESPLYQGDSIRSSSDGIWGQSVDFFKENSESQKPTRQMSPDFLKVVCQHSMRGEIQEITRILSNIPEFQSSHTLLDIGGGHGMYSISFCQQNLGLSAIILDKPSVTPFTMEMIKQYHMVSRISVEAGDMNVDIPGSGYDMVFASHILYRAEDLHVLLKGIAAKIKSRGFFISNHKFEDDWIIPKEDALKAMNTVFIRGHHHMVTRDEFKEMLESSGLSGIQSF